MVVCGRIGPTEDIQDLIMTNSDSQFVTRTYAEFLLDNANNGNEILAVLDDLYEVQSTPL